MTREELLENMKIRLQDDFADEDGEDDEVSQIQIEKISNFADLFRLMNRKSWDVPSVLLDVVEAAIGSHNLLPEDYEGIPTHWDT